MCLFLKPVGFFACDRNFTFAEKVYDIAVNPISSFGLIQGFVSDYDVGLVPFIFNMEDEQINNFTAMNEFVNAKVINWVPYDEVHKLLISLDQKNGSSFVVIYVFQNDFPIILYDDINLLDGPPKHVTSINKYASVMMENTLLITQIGQRSDNIYKYINTEGLEKAKLYNATTNKGIWLVYTINGNLSIDYILWNSGYLLCDANEELTKYTFEIIGHSQSCGYNKDGSRIMICNYQVNATLEIIYDFIVEIVSKTKTVEIIVLSIVMAVIVILLIILFIIRRRYIKIEQEKEKYKQLQQNPNQTPQNDPIGLSNEVGISVDDKPPQD